MNIKILLFIFSTCILSGCRWNDADLGNNYYYLNQYNSVDYGFTDGAIIYKSTQENVFQDIKVSGNVVKVNFNEDYIIAKRIENNNMYDTTYFIIVKKLDKVIGPLKMNSFRQMENKLKIELKL